ncbi:MAG: hypothetical protein FJZ75_00590 [Bacteroidetes bacterium]|nr:hypothetical protein [Bacteroidota bacterium]
MQEVLEYCIDQRMAFRSLPRGNGDEWELEFFPENHVQAVALGMFLREHKLELVGFGAPSPALIQRAKPKRIDKKVESSNEIQPVSPKAESESTPIEFIVQTDNSISPITLTASEEEFQIETTPTIEGKPTGFGLFDGDNEEAPFS